MQRHIGRASTTAQPPGLLQRALPVWGWGLAALTTLLALLSLRWGIVQDAPLMFYIGREVAGGARPVIDIFDMNLPLVYWMHAGLWRLFGMNELAWRLVDLATMAAVLALGHRLIAPKAQPFVGFAVLAIAGVHLTFGPEQAGQRDVMMLVPILGACLLLVGLAEGRASILAAVGAGLLLGLAAMLKPVAVLYAPLLGIATVLAAPHLRSSSGLVGIGAAMALGFAVPCLAVLLVLHLQGVLPAFVEIWSEYLLPVYGRIGASWSKIAEPITSVSIALGATLAAAAWLGALKRLDARTMLLAAVVLGGFAGYLAQRKGWHYQAAPYVYSAVLLSALLAARVWQAGEQGRALVGYLGLLIGMPQLLSVGLVAAAEIVRMREGPHTPEPFVRQLMADLDANAPPGMPVQVLDTTSGGIAALVRSGRRQPTRFIYDFQFYLGSETPYRTALRSELIARLAAAGPHLLVVTNQQWPGKAGFERVEDVRLWPELIARLHTQYRLVVERASGLPDGKQYRIYRAGP